MNDQQEDDDDTPEASFWRSRFERARRAAMQWDDVDRYDSGVHGKVAAWRGDGLSFDQVLRKLGLDPGDEAVMKGVEAARLD